ncbi:MAG: hypothetical protein COW01_08755 [Bdellovibrionales bacterium CG12_big_fil_rev_8_21_14_0_65_38_15]|nr:MAG: hypothetical protein COW79_04510 [Bdellovibrionales bacterium CG22_combo_CG10-13_8_21_14_all_38_13]PIQ55037.1 MAG: hypothetical protein COW01_08755 [Bdellovibrionales bacterium CG12_big_fil_rev_8_21_14_0_65_38_15]
MKILAFLGLLAVSLSFNAQADSAVECLEILTHNNASDSFAYTLNVDEINDRYFGNDHLASGIHYVKAMLEKKGCSRSQVNFGRGALGRSKSRCQMLAPHIPTSMACYIESNLGYFFVTRDQMTKVHVVYNRWD